MKLPWFKFNPSWWTSDPELSKCTPATRGVWIDLICAMHQSDRSGELRGTTDQIARLARCSTVELTQALTELQTTGTADVTFRNENVTVINRLMKREAKARAGAALRAKKHRSNVKSNAPVTPEKKEDRRKKKENTGTAPDLIGSNLYRKPEIPSLETVQRIFYNHGGTAEMAQKFFEKHTATGWFLNGSAIVKFASLVPGFISAWASMDNSGTEEKKMVI